VRFVLLNKMGLVLLCKAAACITIYIAESWEEGTDSATILAARERLKQGTDVVDKLTKDSGSYLNEVRIILAQPPRYLNLQKTSGFTLRTRLQEIVLWISLPQVEKEYDPTSLFVVASGVSSDDPEWDAELRCRK